MTNGRDKRTIAGGDRHASPRLFTPESFDPRNASTTQVRDQKIASRRQAGLPDWPTEPLYPDRPARFTPDTGSQQSSLVNE
jgi:hypothetical protein